MDNFKTAMLSVTFEESQNVKFKAYTKENKSLVAGHRLKCNIESDRSWKAIEHQQWADVAWMHDYRSSARHHNGSNIVKTVAISDTR